MAKVSERANEAIRALVAFNGSGIAGSIALMQTPGKLQFQIKLCGGVFLIGFLCAVAAWFVTALAERKEHGTQPSILPLAVGSSAFLFVVGVFWAFLVAVRA